MTLHLIFPLQTVIGPIAPGLPWLTHSVPALEVTLGVDIDFRRGRSSGVYRDNLGDSTDSFVLSSVAVVEVVTLVALWYTFSIVTLELIPIAPSEVVALELVSLVQAVQEAIAHSLIWDTLFAVTLEVSWWAHGLLDAQLGRFVRTISAVGSLIAQEPRINAVSISALEFIIRSAESTRGLVFSIPAILSPIANPRLMDANVG